MDNLKAQILTSDFLGLGYQWCSKCSPGWIKVTWKKFHSGSSYTTRNTSRSATSSLEFIFLGRMIRNSTHSGWQPGVCHGIKNISRLLLLVASYCNLLTVFLASCNFFLPVQICHAILESEVTLSRRRMRPAAGRR